MSVPSLDSFLGCLFGAAIGDALGAPLSGHPRAGVTLPPAGELTYTRLPTYPLGQTTDDTQMLLAIAESIVREHGVDGHAMAVALQDLWATGDVIAPRPTCTQAIDTMRTSDKPWYACGVPAPCADVGSVTRVAVIGLWRCTDSRGLVRDAELCSKLTHGDERAGAAAVAVARAVAFMCLHAEARPERCLYRVGIAAGQVLPSFADWVVDLGEIISLPPMEAEEAIRRIGEEDRPQEDSTPRWSNAAQVVLWGLYCTLRTPKDFISAMRTAIGAGGEADACGAIAGAMIGAHVGYRALPRHLVKDLWGADAIREVGKALFEQYAAANPNAE